MEGSFLILLFSVWSVEKSVNICSFYAVAKRNTNARFSEKQKTKQMQRCIPHWRENGAQI